MEEQDLRQFVLDFCDGKLFTSRQIKQNDSRLLMTIFMPLALGALAGRSQAYYKQVGLLWEYLNAAAPQSINGYPIFFSMRIMHLDDWRRAIPVINLELERRKSITL